MKLLLDEMYSPVLARELRARGHDVEAVLERSLDRGTTDQDLLELARREGRVLVSENIRDFRRIGGELRAAGHPQPDVILIPSTAFPRSRARTVGRLVRALDGLLRDPPLVVGELWLDSTIN